MVIFTLGLLLGVVIESKRLDYMSTDARIQDVNYESLQLQYVYLSTLTGNDSCNAFSATLNSYIHDLEVNRVRLQKYIEGSTAYSDEFDLLKREYTLSQINYWILSKRSRELCSTDLVTVLYFHSEECGDDCTNQGFILDYLKRVFGDKLLIFAFDTGFKEEPMIDILKQTYNVTETPTVVIEDVKLVGFQSKQDLMDDVCSLYRERPVECESMEGGDGASA